MKIGSREYLLYLRQQAWEVMNDGGGYKELGDRFDNIIIKEVNKLKEQNRLLVDALEYYADEDHLHAHYPMNVAIETLEKIEEL